MRINTFQVIPRLPRRLAGLRDMAFNFMWSWNEEMRALFVRLDRELWERTYQNPVLTLGTIAQERLDELAEDEGFLANYDRTYAHFTSYMSETSWWHRRYKEKPLIAYFSAEFGLAECLPIYSGGLGVLAGHHLKSASDLGVPLVGVGLLYQQGYFRQYLTADGWQQERYQDNDFYNLPVTPLRDQEEREILVEVRLAGQTVKVKVWRADVGRVPLLLLDTNIPDNRPDLQDITDQLYGGDQENRIRQEYVLGIGGLRALRAAGFDPAVCHMNEGHSAFLSLERIRTLMREHQVSFAEALEAVRAGSVFTTHTPVPAGFDIFPPEMVERYFAEYVHEVGITAAQLLALGRGDGDAGFNMAVLALRTTAFANGVSRLHGEVSRELFHRFMPNLPVHEVPIGHVTNGAHTRSCVSKEMGGLFDRYLGPDWWRHPGLAETWAGVDQIPDEELWATHERRRERLVAFSRQRLSRQMEQRGASRRDLERARGVLDTRTLTIGFARRFATYKRAALLFTDPERLKKILLNPERPVQIIFAGKAHPKDNEGKEVLKRVVSFCQNEELRRHLVFLEDYDLVVARYLVQGVDVWLNTPRRPMEASGTSGMKVLPNGGLNLSIPDGWWEEAYQPEVGWVIGQGEEYEDYGDQDQVESNAVYKLLEDDITPLFYARAIDGLPRAWIARMKKSMRLLTPAFSTNRMIWEYAERYYLPASRHFARLAADGMAKTRAVAIWLQRVRAAWGEVQIEEVEAVSPHAQCAATGFDIHAVVHLGPLATSDVAVEIYYGPLDAERDITAPAAVAMSPAEDLGGGRTRFSGTIPCDRSGMIGYTVRVRPVNPDAPNLLATNLMTWW
ncbi:MAG: alpha-glucan family phosphorylase [Thermoanaerobaculaceae bacterium]|nr:alpha-glucan family phosphorylase [Thermoanaerobaculaceae bacterium]MDI9621089.1 alpha-glucan family phosphorylase [Acidobacteriota bacterium]HPW55524.1 alpha-glucan family phosphorylase [Thermoanaerobaculaceae bacterium]